MSKDLTAYDLNRAEFTEYSILYLKHLHTDFYCRSIEKLGRRWIVRGKRANNNGILVGCFMYVSEVSKAIKSGQIEVFKK